MKWLVTGGAGYIGSHVVKLLANQGDSVSVLDNFSINTDFKQLSGVGIFNEDISNSAGIKRVFYENKFDGVIHLAAKKSVAESFEKENLYHNVNVFGTLNVLNNAIYSGVGTFIYSSSAAVYGIKGSDPIKETEETNPISPYGLTKLIAEDLVTSAVNSGKIRGGSVRYFNVAGKDSELPSDTSKSNIYPAVFDSVINNKKFSIFGNTYPTRDGTCIRDYIHVLDIARFHIEYAKILEEDNCPTVLNAGTGGGYSVKEVIDSINNYLKYPIQTQVLPPRDGDPAVLVADTTLSKRWMNFSPEYTLDDISYSAVEGFYRDH